MLNSLLNRKKKTDCIDETGNIANTSKTIASSFNSYFSNIALKLKTEINATETPNLNDSTYQEFIKNPVSNTLYLNSVHNIHK